MSTPVIVDASVAFKWFAPIRERGVEEALDLLDAHRRGEVTLSAPSLLPFEVLNALRWSSASDEALCHAARVLAAVEIDLVEPSEPLLESTVRSARDFGLTVYDAAYFALASLFDASLVTADRKAFSDVSGIAVRFVG